MDKIKVIDARMGRGKTTAVIQYMRDNNVGHRFLYITPFLSEVERVCTECGFKCPDDSENTKLMSLKKLMLDGENVATTHALFYLMDDVVMNLAKYKGYDLVIDESISPINKINITVDDMRFILNQFVTVSESGQLKWIDKTYKGSLSKYKEKIDAGGVHYIGGKLLEIIDPEKLKSFNDVVMMTYLFDGQYQREYLEFFHLDYVICGIENRGDGSDITDFPDCPPPMDYKRLITIVDDKKMNEIGSRQNALSKSWFLRRGRDSADIKKLRCNLGKFFRCYVDGSTKNALWTCFKDDADKLYGDRNRYSASFLQINARATNEYRECTAVAYLANRYPDPSITNFFYGGGVKPDVDQYALAEMLQFIWRSAIRDGKPITVYIPSKRMRDLLIRWIDKNSIGGDVCDD